MLGANRRRHLAHLVAPQANRHEARDAAVRRDRVAHEELLRLRTPEPGIRAKSAPVPEREAFGDPDERWQATSPVLRLSYETLTWHMEDGADPVIVRRFLVGVHGFD